MQALDQVSFSVPAGSIYGLLGPNGSGKTTTLGIVLDVLNATAGTFRWFNQPLTRQTKQRIGALLETPNFYPYLSAYQNLQITADLKNIPPFEINQVLETVGLLERRNTAFKGFSLGMKQRLALAATLLGNPEVLVLDEPTNGLDPQGIAEVRELIQRVAQQGKTIIIASHLLDEVEKVCTHVAVLQAGKLRADGPVATILAQQDQIIIRTEDMARAMGILQNMPAVINLKTDQENIILALQPGFTSADLNRTLFEHGVILSQLTVKKKSLESQFLDIINNRT